MKKRIFYIFLLAFSSLLASADDNVLMSNQEEGLNLLVTRDSLPYKEGDFLVLHGMGLFMRNDHDFTSLDAEKCPNISRFHLKNRYRCDNLFTYNGQFVMQCENYLLHLSGDSTNVIVEMEDEDFMALPGQNGLFSIVTSQINEEPTSSTDSVLYVWSLYDSTTEELTVQKAFPDPIKDVICVDEDDYFIVTGTAILRCNTEGTYLMAEAGQPILSAAVTDTDLYFATAEAIYRVCDDGESYPLVVGNMYAMFIDQNRMYLVMEDGNVYWQDL